MDVRQIFILFINNPLIRTALFGHQICSTFMVYFQSEEIYFYWPFRPHRVGSGFCSNSAEQIPGQCAY